jgi:hypothetical protein
MDFFNAVAEGEIVKKHAVARKASEPKEESAGRAAIEFQTRYGRLPRLVRVHAADRDVLFETPHLCLVCGRPVVVPFAEPAPGVHPACVAQFNQGGGV